MPPAHCDLLLTPELSVWKKQAQAELRKTLLCHLFVRSVFSTLTACMQKYEQMTAAYGEQGVESNSGQQWPTYTYHLLVWKKRAAEGNISPSLCTLVCILQSSPGSRWRNEGDAPPHQHLGGISVNRDGSKGLEGKVNNVRNRIWSLLTVQRLPLEVRDCASEAPCWIIQYYGWLGCLELSSCQKSFTNGNVILLCQGAKGHTCCVSAKSHQSHWICSKSTCTLHLYSAF